MDKPKKTRVILKLTDEGINEIVNLYKTTIPSTHKLAEKYHLGHKKITEILKNNGVEVNKRGAQIKFGNSAEIEKTKSNIYSSDDITKKLIAVCKKTGVTFDDPNNLSGSLSRYISETYGSVQIPTNTYQRKKYELEYGKKWFEEYFDIIEVKKNDVRICKLCEWETEDIHNKTGCFENHVKEIHNLSIGEYLVKFPEDEHLHPIVNKHKIRTDLFLDTKNFVTCKLCGLKMKMITNTHLMNKHNLTSLDYKILYPNEKLASITSAGIFSVNSIIGNINMKPTWTSKGEIEVKDFIESLDIIVEKSRNRSLLNGKEIDLILPNFNVGIEYNGLYFHTENKGKHSTYHLNKTISCNNLNYKLIHIFEDEWEVKKDLVKNKLKHILNVNDGVKIGARKVKINIVSVEEKATFLNENHIQGNCSSNINYGAYYNNELIGIMSFNNKRNMTKQIDGQFELVRYATKQNYIISGLASKFLKQFINNYSPKSIISFADRRWTLDHNNNLYTKIGFKLIGINKPNYSYYNSRVARFKRFHKFGFGLNSLKRKYPHLNFNHNDGRPKTEKELMTELGFDRIWDCGLFKYELVITGKG